MSAALLITHRGDHYTIDRVAEEVERLGVEALRLDSDTYPAGPGLELAVDDGLTPRLELAGRLFEPRDISGIWCRRLRVAAPPDGLDPEVAAACERESIAARDAWLAAFEGTAVRWVDRPDRQSLAENKARQLAAARVAGLAVPPTLITNRPDAARAFWRAHDGEVVAKMLTTMFRSMAGHGPKVYTSRMTEADLDGLDGLRLSPMVFQRQVPKAYELRAIVVGDQVFAGRIDAGQSEKGQVDWRRSEAGSVGFAPAVVDPRLTARLVEVNRRLGLVYGAADVIITPDGEPVFLEVNPAGEWGMIERDAGQPIAAAIARALVGGASAR